MISRVVGASVLICVAAGCGGTSQPAPLLWVGKAGEHLPASTAASVFWIHADVNGLPGPQVIVDTGAPFALLNYEAFNGAVPLGKGRVATMTLGNTILWKVPTVAVHSDGSLAPNGRPFGGILGHSVFGQFVMSFDYAGQQVVVGGAPPPAGVQAPVQVPFALEGGGAGALPDHAGVLTFPPSRIILQASIEGHSAHILARYRGKLGGPANGAVSVDRGRWSRASRRRRKPRQWQRDHQGDASSLGCGARARGQRRGGRFRRQGRRAHRQPGDRGRASGRRSFGGAVLAPVLRDHRLPESHAQPLPLLLRGAHSRRVPAGRARSRRAALQFGRFLLRALGLSGHRRRAEGHRGGRATALHRRQFRWPGSTRLRSINCCWARSGRPRSSNSATRRSTFSSKISSPCRSISWEHERHGDRGSSGARRARANAGVQSSHQEERAHRGDVRDPRRGARRCRDDTGGSSGGDHRRRRRLHGRQRHPRLHGEPADERRQPGGSVSRRAGARSPSRSSLR